MSCTQSSPKLSNKPLQHRCMLVERSEAYQTWWYRKKGTQADSLSLPNYMTLVTRREEKWMDQQDSGYNRVDFNTLV